MPVFHIILHAYGSWHPDHPTGWHQHGEGIPFRPQERLGKHRRGDQRWPSAEFAPATHRHLSDMVRDICKRCAWRCHAIAINESHIHSVISWHTPAPEPIDVQTTLKRLLGLRIAQLTSITGRRWFSDGGLPKRVEGLEHLHYLLHEYLPDQGGHFWREGQPE